MVNYKRSLVNVVNGLGSLALSLGIAANYILLALRERTVEFFNPRLNVLGPTFAECAAEVMNQGDYCSDWRWQAVAEKGALKAICVHRSKSGLSVTVTQEGCSMKYEVSPCYRSLEAKTLIELTTKLLDVIGRDTFRLWLDNPDLELTRLLWLLEARRYYRSDSEERKLIEERIRERAERELPLQKITDLREPSCRHGVRIKDGRAGVYEISLHQAAEEYGQQYLLENMNYKQTDARSA